MARERFQLILRFLHFQDNEDPQYNQQDPNRDRLFKIRNILEKTREKFKTVYYPSEDITLDESLVLYKGRLLFKQYIKTKRSRFGIKFFELTTADGILLDFMIYQGNMEPALFQPPGENWLITERIPLTLAQPYLDKGHTLTLDNWYTTPKLADYLMERSTKLVGTIRANRKNFPKDFPADKAMPKGGAAFKYHQQILVMKYRAAQNKAPSKPKIVYVISTKHGSRMQNTTRRDAEGNIVQKPEAILYYNRKMGGVDTMDQQLHGIRMMRKTYKWYHKIFFRIMMMALLSAQKIQKKEGGSLEFLQFVHDVVLNLLSDVPALVAMPRRFPVDSLIRLTERHFPEQTQYDGPAAKRKHVPKRCRVCSARQKKTTAGHPIKSQWQCQQCPGNPGLCPGEYFKVFHTVLDYSK